MENQLSIINSEAIYVRPTVRPASVREAGFNEEDHPRHPKGDPRGGQFAPKGEGGGAGAPKVNFDRWEIQARKEFGVTENPHLAGYILSDGEMLDFSQGQGFRVLDHRQINAAAEDQPVADGYSEVMFQFAHGANAVRMSFPGKGDLSLDFYREPTRAQWRRIEDILPYLGSRGQIIYDVSNARGNVITSGIIDADQLWELKREVQRAYRGGEGYEDDDPSPIPGMSPEQEKEFRELEARIAASKLEDISRGDWDRYDVFTRMRRRAGRERDRQLAEDVSLGKRSIEELQKKRYEKDEIGLPTTYPSSIDVSPDELIPLPKKLYHVTTAADLVIREGLKPRSERTVRAAGLGGGPDSSISFTDNLDNARAIQKGLIEAHMVASGKITPQQLLDIADKGTGADRPWGKKLREAYESRSGKGSLELFMQGKKPDYENDPFGVNKATVDLTESERRRNAMALYKAFAMFREEAGGGYDPFFAFDDENALAELDLSQVAILEYESKPGTLGARNPVENEYRTWSGKAVAFKRALDRQDIVSLDDPMAVQYLRLGPNQSVMEFADLSDERIDSILQSSDPADKLDGWIRFVQSDMRSVAISPDIYDQPPSQEEGELYSQLQEQAQEMQALLDRCSESGWSDRPLEEKREVGRAVRDLTKEYLVVARALTEHHTAAVEAFKREIEKSLPAIKAARNQYGVPYSDYAWESADERAKERIREIAQRNIEEGESPVGSENVDDEAEIIEQYCVDALRNITENADVFIRVQPEDVEMILKDKRFKSQYETFSTNGCMDHPSRQAAEGYYFELANYTDSESYFEDDEEKPRQIGHQMHLIPDAASRPIYGYLASKDTSGFKRQSSVAHYGTVAFRLKSNVRNRTSFIAGDSLDRYVSEVQDMRPGAACSKLTDPDIAALDDSAIEYFSRVMKPNTFDRETRPDEIRLEDMLRRDYTDIPYFEAQIHHGVFLEDIEEVIFSNVEDRDRLAPLLNRYRIKHRYTSEGT